MGYFSKKSYPEAWLNYSESFRSKSKEFEQIRLVVLDTETTGLNTEIDRILSIGAIGIQDRKIKMSDVFECFVLQETFTKETVAIHGIRKSLPNKSDEKDAIFKFLGYINNAVLVGHHIGFDITMINQSLSRLNLPKLKNTVLDTGNLHLKTFIDLPKKQHFSLDHLALEYGIAMHDRHNACGDAFITAQLFLKILKKLEKNNPLSLSYLKKPAKRIGLL